MLARALTLHADEGFFPHCYLPSDCVSLGSKRARVVSVSPNSASFHLLYPPRPVSLAFTSLVVATLTPLFISFRSQTVTKFNLVEAVFGCQPVAASYVIALSSVHSFQTRIAHRRRGGDSGPEVDRQ